LFWRNFDAGEHGFFSDELRVALVSPFQGLSLNAITSTGLCPVLTMWAFQARELRHDCDSVVVSKPGPEWAIYMFDNCSDWLHPVLMNIGPSGPESPDTNWF
jgi:hypothetical protein